MLFIMCSCSVAVICVILLERKWTPWGDKERGDMQEWAAQEFSLGKKKKELSREVSSGVFDGFHNTFLSNDEQKHINERFMGFNSWPHILSLCFRSPPPLEKELGLGLERSDQSATSVLGIRIGIYVG